MHCDGLQSCYDVVFRRVAFSLLERGLGTGAVRLSVCPSVNTDTMRRQMVIELRGVHATSSLGL